jgi:ATP-dependent DNA helicase DinG
MLTCVGKTCEDVFPEGRTPRPAQVRCINEILRAFESGKKFVIINAPTGSGKSFISASMAPLCDPPSDKYRKLVTSYEAYNPPGSEYVSGEPPCGMFTLTTTKSLQDQYLDTFEYGKTLKGKSNYQCAVDPAFAVDFAPCIITPKLKRECFACDRCVYYKARNDVLVNPFSILNYSMFFHLPDHIKKRNIIVCDEASELEEELVKAFSVNITYKHLDTVGIKYEKLDDETKAKEWFTDIFDQVKTRYEELIQSFSEVKANQRDIIKLRYLTQLTKSLENVIGYWGSVEFVIEKDDKTIQAIPLKVDYLSHNLFDYADHIILMSATIIDHANFADTLGIEDYHYIEVDSTFDPKKSPIYVSAKYPLTFKTMKDNLPHVVDMAHSLVNKHKDEKGIIHTHTFNISEAVKRKMNGRRFLYREEGSSNEDILNEHALRTDPTVLVSPSMAFGVDLKDDAARWQIIMKLPYPPLGSKRVKKLCDMNYRWYVRKMLTGFVQMCGRSTRSEQDYSTTYVLDGGIIGVLQKHKDMLPKYFLARFV